MQTLRRLTILLLLALPAGVYAQFECTTNNGRIIITKYTGHGGSVTIPDTINGLPVTSIGFYAFSGRTSLTNVNISENISNIGEGAFVDCFRLSSVTIPQSVTNIDNQAFYSCRNLAEVHIPNRVTHIGYTAFYNCGLTNIMIPSSVAAIGHMAFAGCANLRAIMVDSNNPNYCSLDGVLFNKRRTILFEYPGGRAGNYVIPNGVTFIGLESFCDCSLLTGVTTPDSVTRIDFGAFNACASMEAITVATSNRVYSSLAGVLFDKRQTVLIRCPENKSGDYTIPDSVTRIADEAFLRCKNLTRITIPGSVTTIDNWAFESCSKLASITIPNSVTSIGFHPFTSCCNLTNVTLSDQVVSIGIDAFRWCTNLTSITIPASVIHIGDAAFANCTAKSYLINGLRESTNYISLERVYFKGNAPTLGRNVFNSDDHLTNYYLPGKTGWGATFGGRPTAVWKQ